MEFNPSDDVNTNMGKLFALINNMDTRAEDRHKFIKSELTSLKFEQKRMKSSHLKLKEKCQFLAGEVQDMKRSLNNFEQRELNSNVIIRGVPEVPNEKQSETGHIVYEILKLLSFESSNEIVDIFRFGQSGKSPRPIMLKMFSSASKKTLLSSKKKCRIAAESIRINGRSIGSANDVIFMDEQLTPFSASIYYGARNLKKEKVVSFAWTTDGTVFVKKDEKSKPIKLSSPREVSIVYERLTGRKMLKDDLYSPIFDYDDELDNEDLNKSTESPKRRRK